MAGDLEELRDRIEAVSEELVRLLNERFELSLAIGRQKRRSGRAFRDPERERELLQSLVAKNEGPMPPETLEAIFRMILDTSVRLMESEERSEEGHR